MPSSSASNGLPQLLDGFARILSLPHRIAEKVEQFVDICRRTGSAVSQLFRIPLNVILLQIELFKLVVQVATVPLQAMQIPLRFISAAQRALMSPSPSDTLPPLDPSGPTQLLAKSLQALQLPLRLLALPLYSLELAFRLGTPTPPIRDPSVVRPVTNHD